MQRRESPSRATPLAALGVVVAALCQVGCSPNRVEMPRATAGAVAPAVQGKSVAYAEARCFLYRRDGVASPGYMELLRAQVEREGQQGGALRCGRPVAAGPPPLLARTLVLGETFGFRRDPAGRLLAVAGEEHIPLDDGRYAWEAVPTRYTSEQRSAQIVGGLFIGALGTAAPR